MGVRASQELQPTLRVRAEASEVSRASAWLHSMCAQADVPLDQQERLDICLNEALANILSHGQTKGKSQPIQLDFVRHDDSTSGQVSLAITDHGIAFDPLSVAPRTLPDSLADAEPGGLGLVMLRQFSDRLDYSFVDGQNKLSITMRWSHELA